MASLFRQLLTAAVLAIGIASVEAARADDVALVVVNAAHRDLAPLPLDGVAEALESELAAAGFRVTVLKNATTGGLLSALRRISAEPDPDGAAVFYFAGYARQLRGRNFMIARNAKPARPFDFVTQGVDLDSVLSSLAKAGGRAQFAVIDGAYPEPRLDGLSGLEPGLADQPAQPGSAVVLGAEPGVILQGQGGGSQTASAFAEVMAVPTARLDALALGFATRAEQLSGRRMHVILGSDANVALVAPVLPDPEPDPEPDRPAVTTTEPSAPAPKVTTAPADPVVDPAPTGPKRVAAPEPAAPEPTPDPAPAMAAPEPLSAEEVEAQLDVDGRRAIQWALQSLGIYQGGIDGAFGPLTRRAITTFQKLRGFDATGVLTASEMDLLFELAGS